MRRFLAIGATAVLMACGGDSTAPPPFPAVAGTYRIEIAITGLPASVANGTGTLTIAQPSRNAPELTGSANVVVLVGGSTVTLTQFTNATVTEAGAIRFQLPPPNTSSVWGFDGTVAVGGKSMSGSHLLVGTTSSTPGTWTATRQ
jgi:hypothetical protein